MAVPVTSVTPPIAELPSAAVTSSSKSTGCPASPIAHTVGRWGTERTVLDQTEV